MYSVTATVFLLLSCFGSTVFATCYNPDGTALDGDNAQAFQPCNQIAGVVSQCCGTNWSAVAGSKVENDQCQSNGLCLNTANNAPLYWRSSCTDKTWQSPLCLKNLCTKPNNGGSSSENVALTQCVDGSWCCGGGNTTCCTNNQGTQLAATIGVGPSSTSQSSTPTSTSSQTPTSTPTQSPQASQGLATGAMIGIGIGVPCAVLILAFGAYMLYRRRLSKKSATGNEKWNTEPSTQQYPQELQGNPLAAESELPADTSSYTVQSPKELSAHKFDGRK